MTLEINPLQYAIEINVANTKGCETYLILKGCSRSLLNFSTTLVPTFHSQQRNNQAWYMLSVRHTLAYINPTCLIKYNYIHGYNIHIYAHVLDRKWISINKNRDTIVTTSISTSSNPRNRVLHLGLHHFNPPYLNGNLTKKWKYWEKKNYVVQRDNSM